MTTLYIWEFPIWLFLLSGGNFREFNNNKKQSIFSMSNGHCPFVYCGALTLNVRLTFYKKKIVDNVHWTLSDAHLVLSISRLYEYFKNILRIFQEHFKNTSKKDQNYRVILCVIHMWTHQSPNRKFHSFFQDLDSSAHKKSTSFAVFLTKKLVSTEWLLNAYELFVLKLVFISFVSSVKIHFLIIAVL